MNGEVKRTRLHREPVAASVLQNRSCCLWAVSSKPVGLLAAWYRLHCFAFCSKSIHRHDFLKDSCRVENVEPLRAFFLSFHTSKSPVLRLYAHARRVHSHQPFWWQRSWVIFHDYLYATRVTLICPYRVSFWGVVLKVPKHTRKRRLCSDLLIYLNIQVC